MAAGEGKFVVRVALDAEALAAEVNTALAGRLRELADQIDPRAEEVMADPAARPAWTVGKTIHEPAGVQLGSFKKDSVTWVWRPGMTDLLQVTRWKDGSVAVQRMGEPVGTVALPSDVAQSLAEFLS